MRLLIATAIAPIKKNHMRDEMLRIGRLELTDGSAMVCRPCNDRLVHRRKTIKGLFLFRRIEWSAASPAVWRA